MYAMCLKYPRVWCNRITIQWWKKNMSWWNMVCFVAKSYYLVLVCTNDRQSALKVCWIFVFISDVSSFNPLRNGVSSKIATFCRTLRWTLRWSFRRIGLVDFLIFVGTFYQKSVRVELIAIDRSYRWKLKEKRVHSDNLTTSGGFVLCEALTIVKFARPIMWAKRAKDSPIFFLHFWCE